MDFWKMNGAGNDFILLNDFSVSIPDESLPQIAKTLCERHLSIGADGLMVVRKPEQGGDYRMLFFNSDGSVGEMCGNGARCICRYGYETGLSGDTQRVETTAGLVTGYRIDAVNYRIRLNSPTVIDLHRTVSVDGKAYDCAYIELGSPGLPHAVVHIPGLETADDGELFRLGRTLRYHSAFPKGANVNFYDLTGKDAVWLRTYERGVEDFTYACGTGTGSTALALYFLHLTGARIEANMRGGTLFAQVDTDENGTVRDLWLTGPTNIVAKGEITDQALTF